MEIRTILHSNGPRKNIYPKRRSAIACDVCRSRKTKCNGDKPQCSFCQTVGANCIYRPIQMAPSPPHEITLSAVLQRVERLETDARRPKSYDSRTRRPADLLHEPEANPFPNKLKKSQLMIRTAGINYDVTDNIVDLETPPSLPTTLLQMPDSLNSSLLTLFFDRIYIWYPILDKRTFAEDFLAANKQGLTNSSSSCLILLVSAIGALVYNVQNGIDDEALEYAGLAFQMLHLIMMDNTLIAIQCLILYGVYYLLLIKPVQAYEYITCASFKIQNLMKRNHNVNGFKAELTRRVYYAIFLLERELLVQLDLAESGIGLLQDLVPLPSGTLELDNNESESVPFFLAEIALRKLMDRATLNDLLDTRHEIRFANLVAAELDFQLVQWRSNLPLSVAFPDTHLPEDDLSLYLQVQYYALMTGIYWPGLYQAIVTKDRSTEMMFICQKCFIAYCSFMDSIEEFCSRPVSIPLISMSLASVFSFTLGMTAARSEVLVEELVALEGRFEKAIEVLRRYSDRSATVNQWTEILASVIRSR